MSTRWRVLSAIILTCAAVTSAQVRSEDLLEKIRKKLQLPAPTQPTAPTRARENADQQAAERETLDPNSDRLCDSLGRSYAFTENLLDLATDQLKCKVMKCRPDEMLPQDPRQLEPWLRNYSKKRVWLPVPLEKAVGATFLNEQQAQGAVLERGQPNTDKLYAKVDQALATAKTSYPEVPYELSAFIVDVTDRVNAQASPGGYIFVTKAAAKDLEADALQLVIGHEVAHLAKRHMSKQLQQRLMESEQGMELFKQLTSLRLESGQQASMAKQIVDRLKCSFAHYEQGQETQADACAVRTMIEAGREPIAAWEEYLRVRGSVAAEPQTVQAKPAACFVSMAAHPEDRQREGHIRSAAAHHHGRLAR
jgi:Zn-dependent protease with chaperone function